MKKAVLCGAKRLSDNKDYINELNVFPVPDGDTGSNMTLTIMSAANAVAALEEADIKTFSKTLSSGALKGARGNSGVILSQLIRGFCREIEDAKEVDAKLMASAFVRGVETAYKAVMKPKEGTILSVAKAVAEKTFEIVSFEAEDIEFIAKEALEYGNYALEHTPDQLPVLKEAGVVDSGGQGLMEFLTGAFMGIIGDMDVSFTVSHKKSDEGAQKLDKAKNAPLHKQISVDSSDISTSDIKYGYCTEFISNIPKPLTEDEVDDFKQFLLSIGDSLVCVADDEFVKVHVHTNHPGLAFEKALELGYLTNMKIDNMREEHKEKLSIEKLSMEEAFAEKLEKDKGHKESPVKDRLSIKEELTLEPQPEPEIELKNFGFAACAYGEGITNVLKDMGVDYVIEGGQTMNPSTEDILDAVDQIPAKIVFVLPNNKNIILAAEQAAKLIDNKKIIVIPSKTIPQGIAAMIGFMDEKTAEENEKSMTAQLKTVASGQITYAVRDTKSGDLAIKKGDFMGIDDTGICSSGPDMKEVAGKLVGHMMNDEYGLLTLYYGAEVKEEEAGALRESLAEVYPDIDIEVMPGGQPVYYYILSLE